MTTRKRVFIAGGIAAWAIIAVIADRALTGDSTSVDTNDAYVTAHYAVIAPKVAGLIDRVDVNDNQYVRAGQELAHIDDRDFRTAVASATAALAGAKADLAILSAQITQQAAIVNQAKATIAADDAALDFAQANAVRYRNLAAGGAGTVEQRQQSTSTLQQAQAAKARDLAAELAAEHQIAVLQARQGRVQADIDNAAAALHQADLNLSYATIVAPFDGVVGTLSVRVGNDVAPGTALLAVVPMAEAYVVANFEETQLTHVLRGERARIAIDALPGQVLTGTVDSLAPASGITFSPIPPDNATGNFTKIVQRIPVKIVFDPEQRLVQRLRDGMSVEATIDITTAPPQDGEDPAHILDHIARR
ncbi:MAG TPA: HlyD family secretion protein [Rhodopila sp.]|jgi:membrane fusion protein (multidrug efflux system)|nr:HlyD family secretion protein [Rhodopila sp.]